MKRAPLRECVLRDCPVTSDKKGKEPCENILDCEAPRQFIWLMQLLKVITIQTNPLLAVFRYIKLYKAVKLQTLQQLYTLCNGKKQSQQIKAMVKVKDSYLSW